MKRRSTHPAALWRGVLAGALLGGGFIAAAMPDQALGYAVNTNGSGSNVKWRSQDIPVTYKINQNGTPDCNDEFNAVQAGFQVWEDECRSTIDFTYGGTTTLGSGSWGNNDGTNLVVWEETTWPIINGNCGLYANQYTLAINCFWYDGGDGHLLDSDIILNGRTYTWSCSGEAGKPDIQNVATHEAGHSLSLADLYGASDIEKTMYGNIANGEVKKRSLEQDDADGVAYLYPSKASDRVYLEEEFFDHGCEPYTGPGWWWLSPDITLNPNPPVLGEQTTITVRARNLWPTAVQGTVTVEVHDPSVSLSPGRGVLWTTTQSGVNIAAGYSDVSFNWTPNPNTFGEAHYCMVAIVTSGNDNTQTGVLEDNNVACHNFDITHHRQGSGGSSGMSVDAANYGSQFITGSFFLDRAGLPEGWMAEVIGPDGLPYSEGMPLPMPPDVHYTFQLLVIPLPSAAPGDSGTVQFFGVRNPPPPGLPPVMGGVGFQVRVVAPTTGAEEEEATPPALRARAHPNPFNARVTLALEIPRAGRVSVLVFDAAGRRIRTLFDETTAAGRREVLWDGRDETGRVVPAGAYFYQLSLDGRRQGGRFLLIK